MQYEISEQPSYAMVEVTLDKGEQMQTKPGVMMTRSGGISVQSDVGGNAGAVGTVKRALSDERTLIDNTYVADTDGETLTLVPEHPGDVRAIDVTEQGELRAQSGSLMAWEPLVERSTEWNNRSNIFSSVELTVLGLSGQGMAFLSSFGSLITRHVSEGDPLIVDEDHIVAWTPSLSLNRQKDGSVKSTLLGGEGFLTEFRGDGRVWLQTRDPMLFSTGSEHEDSDSSGGIGVDDFL